MAPAPGNNPRLALILGLVAGIVAAAGLCLVGVYVLRSYPSLTANRRLAPAGARTTPPAGTATAMPPPTARAAATITGFGATIADWNSLHRKDPTVVDGTAYDPGAVTYAHGTADRFIDVRTSDAGRVVAFTEQMAPHTGVGTARYEASAELPADAFTIWLRSTATCEQLVMYSKTLAAVLVQPHVPDSRGVDSSGFVLIESESGDTSHPDDPYPRQITTMTFSLGGLFPYPEDVTRC